MVSTRRRLSLYLSRLATQAITCITNYSVFHKSSTYLLCRRPLKWGHNALMAVVCRSVPCLILSREWKGVASWKLAERKAIWHGWPVTPFKGRKVSGQGGQRGQSGQRPTRRTEQLKGFKPRGRAAARACDTRSANVVTENQSYLRNMKATSNFLYGWSAMNRIIDIRGDLKGQGYL